MGGVCREKNTIYSFSLEKYVLNNRMTLELSIHSSLNHGHRKISKHHFPKMLKIFSKMEGQKDKRECWNSYVDCQCPVTEGL